MDPNDKVAHGRSGEFCLSVAQYYCDVGHMPWGPGKRKISLAFRKIVAEQYDPANQY